MKHFKYDDYSFAVKKTNPIRPNGVVVQLVGLVIEAQMQGVMYGELCYIYSTDKSKVFPAEVVGFKAKR
ncbi:MAG TPA: hypothetical protein V6C82_00205, partial [Chroococcales cyanobacterium]